MTTGRINQVGTSPQGGVEGGRTYARPPHVPLCFRSFPVVRPARWGVPPTSGRERGSNGAPTRTVLVSRTTEARSSGPHDSRRRQSPLRGADSQDCTDGINVSTPERPFPGDHLHRWTASRGARGPTGSHRLPRASRTGGRFIAERDAQVLPCRRLHPIDAPVLSSGGGSP